MDIKTLLLSQRPPEDIFITLGFGPGVLRFIRLNDLKRSNAVKFEAEVDELSSAVPESRLQFFDWGIPMRLGRAIHCFGSSFDAKYRFMENELFYPSCFTAGIRNIADVCDVFESVVNEFLDCPFPSACYRMFVELLGISDLRVKEFKESW